MSPTIRPVYSGATGAVLCVFLLSVLCSGLRYHLINQSKNWHEAQKHCRQHFVDLATVDNMEDMEWLIVAAGSGFSGQVWIGLRDASWSWRWSHNGRPEKEFTQWEQNEPDNMRNLWELCAGVIGGRWSDYQCDKLLPFVCYENTSGVDSYFFINESKTWHEARTYCRQKHTDLASVRSEEERAAIQGVVPHDKLVAIGLWRPTWVWWSDGTRHNFEYWQDGRPTARSGDCAASVINATSHGKWIENHCNIELPFMCYDNSKQVFRIKLTALESTIDLNDPAVTAAILNLMEKKMKEKWFRTDINISWVKKSDNKIFNNDDKTNE